MNHFSRASIVTPTALYVQICEAENLPTKKQVRIKRGEIASDALSTEMRALGRHIAKLLQKRALCSYSCYARERMGPGATHARTDAGM